MRRLVGYDLTGWRDYAVRNWSAGSSQELTENTEVIVSGGIGGVVVRVRKDGMQNPFVGGFQALRAPHGLGEGWGPLGFEKRRMRIVDLLAKPTGKASEITSALRALADPKDSNHFRNTTAVLAIPDTGEFELEQEELLEAFRLLGVNIDSLLIWRPVLACLTAIEDGDCEGIETVGVVGHDAVGLTSQKIKLRKVNGQLAPERRKSGQSHPWKGGLCSLLQEAHKAMLTPLGRAHKRSIDTDFGRWIVPLALGESLPRKIVRQPDGGWRILEFPTEQVSEFAQIPSTIVNLLRECQIILVDTPTSGSIRGRLVNSIRSEFKVRVRALEHHDLARGGLIAAGKIARGEPVYFDFLPQISTIVQVDWKAKNYDLVQNEKPLPAGRIYRSAKPAQMGILPDSEQIKVYLRKEAEDQCRLAIVRLPYGTERAANVNLHVEQTPAAGRARLTLVSEIFPTPRTVDWETAKVQDESWEVLIKNLQPDPPSIPKRQVLPNSLNLWHHAWRRQFGLRLTLVEAYVSDQYAWKKLANQMSAHRNGGYAISSDGKLPMGLDEYANAALEKATQAAEDHVVRRLNQLVFDNNDSLRFLTWQFRRCPKRIVSELLEAVEKPTHTFLRGPGGSQLVYQALGRVVNDFNDLRKVFKHLLKLKPEDWKRDQLACAAQLLARTDAPTEILDRQGIEFFVNVVLRANRCAIGGDYTSKYFYTPYILVGLLRSRERDLYSLIAGRDILADKLLDSTQNVIADLETRRFPDGSRIQRIRDVLNDCCDELKGKGSNPDILYILDKLA